MGAEICDMRDQKRREPLFDWAGPYPTPIVVKSSVAARGATAPRPVVKIPGPRAPVDVYQVMP
jgi:hypothetical protein